MSIVDVLKADDDRRRRNSERLHDAIEQSHHALLRISDRRWRVIKISSEANYNGYGVRNFAFASEPLTHGEAISLVNQLNGPAAKLVGWE